MVHIKKILKKTLIISTCFVFICDYKLGYVKSKEEMGLKVLINFSPHLFYLKCNILFTHLFVNSYLYARC